MKILKLLSIHVLVLTIVFFTFTGCEDILTEPVHSQLAPDNLLNTEQGIESTLAAAYSHAANMNFNGSVHSMQQLEMSTDILNQIGGGAHAAARLYMDFTWDANSASAMGFAWQDYWQAIRNANIVLDNLDNASISNDVKASFFAEAKFIRAWAYYDLFIRYGAMPIRKSAEDPPELPRANEGEFFEFIESELLAIIPELPHSGDESSYGRAHRTAAQGLLMKFYLNYKEWEKTVSIAQDIIDEGYYELYPNYTDMFALENEQNSEFIWIRAATTNSANNNNVNVSSTQTLPVGFHEAINGGIDGVVVGNWAIFASNYRINDEFYHSFDPNDDRRTRIMTRYINSQGIEIDILNDSENDTRPMKYPPDPNAIERSHGNDIPYIRYADVLLSKAEALNEIQGPNQESIDMINQIRNRAGLTNVSLEDFSSTEALRNHLVDERGWEFWFEAQRKVDLRRMGVYISKARERGVMNAQEHHEWFPIPQSAIDANPALVQNPGY